MDFPMVSKGAIALLLIALVIAVLIGFVYGAMQEPVAHEFDDSSPRGHNGTVITQEPRR